MEIVHTTKVHESQLDDYISNLLEWKCKILKQEEKWDFTLVTYILW